MSGARSNAIDDAATAVLEDMLRLGAAALRADVCLLGLTSPSDGWVRSVLGVPPDQARKYAAFCSFAMMQAGTTVVTDLRRVAALTYLPKVSGERGYRWLAGGPIVDGHDVKRGGLAALGSSPRELSREDRELLAGLGRQITAFLEQRWRIDELWTRGLHQAGALSMLRGVLKASTTVAVIGTDPSGRIKLFSEGAERMFGVPAREAVGRTAAFLLADPDAGRPRHIRPVGREPGPPPFSALVDGVGPGAPAERAWMLRRADGSVFPGSIVAAFVANETADTSGYALIARDVTEQRAEERMKDDFVSMVSHELRTPLTAIRGALGLLANDVAGPLTEPVRELVDIANESSDRLLHVVGDILDVQRLAAGRLDLTFARFDLRRAVDRAVHLVAPLGSARAVTIAPRRVAPDCVVEADFDRVVQVLVNLLSNAVKHSPEGGTVHVDIDAREEGARVSVEDAGPGVPEHQQGRLFQKFARLSEDPGGTGLGLAIVKALVGLHGGTVGFRPAAPGAIFFFDLPRSQSSPASQPVSTPSSGPVSTEPISLRCALTERRRPAAG